MENGLSASFGFSPIHLDTEFKASIKEQCCKIMNHEWPRSESLRWRMLDSSRDELPMSLALVQWFKSGPCVLGHTRLSRIPSDTNAVWIESFIIHPELRGKGWGKYLMRMTEIFCKETLGLTTLYLCTIDQQIFYARCGFQTCESICSYNGNIKLSSNLLDTKIPKTDLPQTKPSSLMLKFSPSRDAPLNVPAPPPLPPSSNTSNPKDQCSNGKVDFDALCKKFFSPLVVKNILPLDQPLSEIQVPLHSKKGNSHVCRVTMPKTYMKKTLF